MSFCIYQKFKKLFVLIFLLFVFVQFTFSQNNDFDVANQYVIWIRQAIEENRNDEVWPAIRRALDFSDVNSDISYLAGFISSQNNTDRNEIISYLERAIAVNRWGFYSKNEALILLAEQFINVRKFTSALNTLDQMIEDDSGRISLADIAVLRLRSFRGIAISSIVPQDHAAFRALTLSTMNRFSRDPRPCKIFLEYLQARNVTTEEISPIDRQIIDLIIRRLPILAELDPNLAWMSAPFLQNLRDAQRFVAAYRAGSFSGQQARDFYPHPGSISLALHLGLIDENTAIEELFSGTRGKNNPLPVFFTENLQGGFRVIENYPVIDFDIVNNVFDMLRSDNARDLFTRTLFSFEGYMTTDSDNDGIIDSYVLLDKGGARILVLDRFQNNTFDIIVSFDSAGIPEHADVVASGTDKKATVIWERYPFVNNVSIFNSKNEGDFEIFNFRAADFSFSPIEFITLGGSRSRTGLQFPVISQARQLELSRRTLISFSSSFSRPSLSDEFKNAREYIIIENGIPIQIVEIVFGIYSNQLVSLTEFENGFPVISFVDLDLDGRLETVRRFHRPGNDIQWPDYNETFNYRQLISHQESDWRGDGLFKTGEVYLFDDSVVYKWDIDGNGIMNYSEIRR